MYKIDTYKEDYLESQVKIGLETYKNWNSGAQTSVVGLKQAYQGDGFDPETKFYALKDDKVVGFITATIQNKKDNEAVSARIEWPFVRSGEEAARKPLFQKAIEVLRSKGVTKVLTRAGDGWVGTLDFVKSNDYKFQKLLSKAAVIKPAEVNFDIFPKFDIVEEFDWDKDSTDLGNAFVEALNLNNSQLTGLMDSIERLDEDYTRSIHLIIKQDGKLVGRSLIYSKSEEPTGWMGSTLSLGEDKEIIEKQLLGAGLKQAKEMGISKIHIPIWGPTSKDISERAAKYDYLDLEFYDSVSLWEKDI